MVLGLHFQLPHGVQFNMDTNVTPLGQVRYTAYGSTYAYRGLGNTSPGTSFSGAFFQNVVRGEVLDPRWKADSPARPCKSAPNLLFRIPTEISWCE